MLVGNVLCSTKKILLAVFFKGQYVMNNKKQL